MKRLTIRLFGFTIKWNLRHIDIIDMCRFILEFYLFRQFTGGRLFISQLRVMVN